MHNGYNYRVYIASREWFFTSDSFFNTEKKKLLLVFNFGVQKSEDQMKTKIDFLSGFLKFC